MVKEKIRDLKLGKVFRIKTTRRDVPYWEKNDVELLNDINEIVNAYNDENIRLTQRQLYYQLVGMGKILNDMNVYKRICKFVTDCRYAGLIDWDAIEDRGRVPVKHAEWDNVSDLMESAVYSYRLPRWSDQEYYVELYCEKEAMTSVFKPVCDKYHVYFGANKGYSSASTMYEIANRLYEKAVDDGQNIVLLYFGDHDSSGIDMIRDIRERIQEFMLSKLGVDKVEDSEIADELLESQGINFQVVPVALTIDQVRHYDLPPNPAKVTDPRAKDYIEKFGSDSWELDALKPQNLRKMAETNILKYIDMNKFDSWKERENKHKKMLRRYGAEIDKEEW